MDSKQKLVGIIGGLSHASSDGYLAGVHQLVNQELGGLNNAEIIQRDVNFAEIREDMLAGDWLHIGDLMSAFAESLISIGADYVAIASNTMHKVADAVEYRIGSEHFIHIGDCITRRCLAAIERNRNNYPVFFPPDEPKRALLLGTMETMTESFLKDRLADQGLEIVLPDNLSMALLEDKIFHELCTGSDHDETRRWYLHMLNDCLTLQPVDAIILGCTELSLLYSEDYLRQQMHFLHTNCGRPLVVIDSKEAHIHGIAQACFGRW